MKLLVILALLVSISPSGRSQNIVQAVNPIAGDNGYLAVFGELPGNATPEKLRLQTHLLYVEAFLREQQPGLTAAQKEKRTMVLDLLREYIVNDVFPVNRDYPGERRPCFIDADGNICAVGYLIEKTKGREVAEAINAKHQYDYLLDMNEPVIEAWADEHGLTLTECAMIQPTYGPPNPAETRYVDIKQGYGISSALVGGTNLALNIANLSGRSKGNPALAYIGIVTGVGQVILGASNIRANTDESLGARIVSYKHQNNLSYGNIALGTATIISSTINLVMNKKMKDTRNSFNVYSYPGYDNSLTMGLNFTRSL